MSNDFIEARWNSQISYNSVGGSGFSTDVIALGSGYVNSNVRWTNDLYHFICSFDAKSSTYITNIHNFFLMIKGGGYRFRFKYHRDYQLSSGHLGIGDGATKTFQLIKNYKYISFNGGTANNLTFAITAVSVDNDTFTIAGQHDARFDVGHFFQVTGSTGNDNMYSTSAVTYTGGNTVITVNEDVSDATVDGSIIPYYTRTIKKPVHGGVPPGTTESVVVYIDGVLQGSGWTVDATTGIITFTSAPAAGEVVTATCDYDIPVRLVDDKEQIAMIGPSVQGWQTINIEEVKL